MCPPRCTQKWWFGYISILFLRYKPSRKLSPVRGEFFHNSFNSQRILFLKRRNLIFARHTEVPGLSPSHWFQAKYGIWQWSIQVWVNSCRDHFLLILIHQPLGSFLVFFNLQCSYFYLSARKRSNTRRMAGKYMCSNIFAENVSIL